MAKSTPFPQPSCVDEYDSESLLVDEALRRVLAEVAPVTGFEKVAIRSALGWVLAEDIYSTINVPSHTNAAMDGYAVRGIDLPAEGETRELTVIGTAWAGKPFNGRVNPGECVRIMTGAAMPQGTDTVVMQEHVERIGATIRLGAGNKPGQNVRAAGEDLAVGEVVLRAGRRMTPADLGLVASLGIGEVTVRRRLRVAFFSTGDELRSIGEPLAEGQIYDSNRYTLYGMLSRLGAEVLDMGIVRDRREDLRQAFEEGARCADVLISSGGVSVGEADFVTETLKAIGKINFWKIAMKPGRPLTFGRIHNTVFFGLPGNPVSVMVTFYQFVQPALRRMMGELDTTPLTVKAKNLSRLKKKPGRIEYQRGILELDKEGQLVVRCTGAQGSGILSSMSQANCFIVLPTEWGQVEAGTLVDVQPFFGLV